MSNFTMAAFHPPTDSVKAAAWMDDYFGQHQYGVKFDGDEKVYTPEEVRIPTNRVFKDVDVILAQLDRDSL